jgi:hypothetical protein
MPGSRHTATLLHETSAWWIMAIFADHAAVSHLHRKAPMVWTLIASLLPIALLIALGAELRRRAFVAQ